MAYIMNDIANILHARAMEDVFYKDRQLLLSAANEIDRLTSWQHIDTAPKDGSKVLCCTVLSHKLGYYAYPVACGYHSEAGSWLNVHDGEWFHGPTHWMPLPEPPVLLLTEEDIHTHSSGQHWCQECGPL